MFAEELFVASSGRVTARYNSPKQLGLFSGAFGDEEASEDGEEDACDDTHVKLEQEEHACHEQVRNV